MYIVGKSGYKANTNEVMEMLGLKGSKLPKEGIPMTLIQGIVIFVDPAPEPRYYESYRGRKILKSSKHRIKAICHCGRQLSAGRLHQHLCYSQGDRVRYKTTSCVGKVVTPGIKYTTVRWDGTLGNSVIHNTDLNKENIR